MLKCDLQFRVNGKEWMLYISGLDYDDARNKADMLKRAIGTEAKLETRMIDSKTGVELN